MDYDYDESSREVVTTIEMIKSMTTTSRRRSSIAKSPMLPMINNGKRGSRPKNFFATNNSAVAVDSSKTASLNSWSTRGVALASIEFKRRLEKKKSKPPPKEISLIDDSHGTKRSSSGERSKIAERQSQRITVLKSIFAAGGEKTNSPAVNLNPRKYSSPSRKSSYTKKTHSKGKSPMQNASYSALPMVSVVKITPQCRPTFHQGTKTSNCK